ncbi:exonuclease SbcCD subunit D [Ornithinibacillus salinisoli]|uniref:Exonuclease SbcCD subunit D n=1 Tax=Ornithinibacillus salinisoli TaxID=1848459 RepID=A0ABW4VVM8_9BACI
MPKQVSFIHTADLHLDSPFKGLANVPNNIFQEVRDSTFTALDNLVAQAINKNVDFVLMVGDLFDNEQQNLKAQIKLRKAFEELDLYHIKVYISYGNHDFIKGNIHPITYPPNVYIFPNEEVQHVTHYRGDHPLVNIYGFSYENRAVTQKKVMEYNIKDEHTPFHIAMLHGSIESNTEHDQYAPFLLRDLAEKPFDYWALGHIHKREILKEHPPIIYPGNIQGRNRKESGEKGCYHITMAETECQADFIPLQAIQFQPITIDVTQCKEVHQLEGYIRKNLEVKHSGNTPKLIDLTIHAEHEEIKHWKNEHLIGDIIEIINEGLTSAKNWMYIHRFHVTWSSNFQHLSYEGEHFLGELTGLHKSTSIQPFLHELFQHKEARKYIENVSEEIEEIKEEAYQLLIHELLRK